MKGDFKEVTYGYCKCGCGEKTNPAPQTRAYCGHIKGEHVGFISGHNTKPKFGKDNPMYGRTGKDSPQYGVRNFGKDNPNWQGGKHIKKCKHTSYVMVLSPGHPRSDNRGYVREHILVAEKALSKPLPIGAQVHHVDKNGLNNKNNNLVICQDQAYHSLLHVRQRRLNNALY